MNLLKSTAVSWACFLLLLISLTGCATYEPDPVASDAHPEKYREVYLLDAKWDPRDVTPRIAARLEKAGFHVTKVPYDHTSHTALKDQKQKLAELAKNREGKEPAVICRVTSLSVYYEIFDRYWSFENIDIEFRDLESGKMVFRTFKNNFDTPVPEETELNHRFVQIADAFFPDQPNPFKRKK